MSKTFLYTRLLRSAMLLTILLIVSPTLFAQSAAVQPCEATPTTKPGTINATIAPTKVNSKGSETIVDSSIADDAAVEKMLAPYAEKVRPLSTVIGKL